jgi:hypothetical protein
MGNADRSKGQANPEGFIYIFINVKYFSECYFWPASRPRRLTPRETPRGIHWIGDWVSPIAGLVVLEKIKTSCTYRESNPGLPAGDLAAILTELSRL